MLNARENLSGFISDLSSKSDVLRVFLYMVDIIVLSFLLFICVSFLFGIMKKRSGRLLVGIFAVILLFALSYLLNLKATFFLLENVMQFGVIAIVVIFQPELRTLLENVGYAGKNLRTKSLFIENDEKLVVIDKICRAVQDMAQHCVGALIIFQREKELNSYDEMKAVQLNSDISYELIENIFFKNSPLHDGALVIRDFRISQARVLFDEISNNPELPLNLGSRHKAGVGATENGNDCIAVIVSEETGQISISHDGELKTNISVEQLYAFLADVLADKDEPDDKTQIKKKIKKQIQTKGDKDK